MRMLARRDSLPSVPYRNPQPPTRTLSDYDRSDPLRRAFALLAYMHHCPRTLASLAAHLGVCGRTVRRDLYTLERAGIPLVRDAIPVQLARRGNQGAHYIQSTTVWRVMPGFACPICRRTVNAGATPAAEGATASAPDRETP